MKPKRWQLLLLSVLVILSLMVAFLPLPVHLPFGGVGVASAATTVVYSVAASADDIAVYYDTAWRLDAATTTQGFVGSYAAASTKYGEGLRFTGVAVPQGATIINAYLTFICSTASALNTCNGKIVAADVDNAGTGILDTLAHYQSYRGTDVGGADNSLRTTASYDWHSIGTWTLGGTFYTGNISNVIQEVVNRGYDGEAGSWQSGNAMVIFVDDHEGHSSATALRYYASWDHLTYAAPSLTIAYINAPPTITTNAASSITSSSATLNGTVTALGGGGNVTSVCFVYDTVPHPNPNPGNVTPASSGYAYSTDLQVVNLGAAGTFNASIGSLSQCQTIYYRAFGNRTDDIKAYGKEHTLVTTGDGIATLSLQVQSKWDDAQTGNTSSVWVLQESAGAAYPGYYTSTATRIGMPMRFLNVAIPQGATIVSAYLWLKCSASQSDVVINTTIRGDLEANAAPFYTAADYTARRGLSGGNYSTGNVSLWDAIPAWTANTWYYSPEIKSIIQEIVNQVAWVSGNALALFWDDHDARGDQVNDHQRGAYCWDETTSGNHTYAPKLIITYVVAPVNAYTQTSQTFASENMIRATLHPSGQRYIEKQLFYPDPGKLTLWYADEDWEIDTTKGTNGWLSNSTLTYGDIHGGVIFPSVTPSDVFGNDTIVYWGRGADDNGCVIKYFIGNDSWQTASVPTDACQWIGDVMYRPADNTFYMATSLTWTGRGWFNKLAKSSPENLMTPANWVAIDMPAWDAPTRSGLQWIEPKLVFRGDYMYLIRQDDYTYYWELCKWNFTVEASPTFTSGNWTLIESSHNANLTMPQDIISIIGGCDNNGNEDNFLCVAEPYETPYPHWKIKYSTDGTTWTLITTLSMMAFQTIPAYLGTDGCENMAITIPFSSTDIFVQIVAEGATIGYSALFNISTGVMWCYYPGTLGYPGGSHGEFIKDGNKYVLGEQNFMSAPSRLTYYTITPSITNTPASKAFGVVKPNTTYWSNGSDPGAVISDAECFESVTNNSPFTLDYITVTATNFTGVITITSGAPGVNQVRLTVFEGGDGIGDGQYVTTSAANFLATVTAGSHRHWEIRLETGTYLIAGVYSGNMTLATDPAGDSEVVIISFTVPHRGGGIGIGPSGFIF